MKTVFCFLLYIYSWCGAPSVYPIYSKIGNIYIGCRLNRKLRQCPRINCSSTLIRPLSILQAVCVLNSVLSYSLTVLPSQVSMYNYTTYVHTQLANHNKIFNYKDRKAQSEVYKTCVISKNSGCSRTRNTSGIFEGISAQDTCVTNA